MTTDETMTEFPAVNDAGLPDETVVEEAPQEKPISRLVFMVGGCGLLLDQDMEMEFMENQMPYHIPNNHRLFRGLINRRGSLVPVFDIRSLLDAGSPATAARRVLVVGSGENAVGIVLDDTPHRVTVTEDQRAPLPGKLVQVFGKHLGACYRLEGKSYTHVALRDFLYGLVHESERSTQ